MYLDTSGKRSGLGRSVGNVDGLGLGWISLRSSRLIAYSAGQCSRICSRESVSVQRGQGAVGVLLNMDFFRPCGSWSHTTERYGTLASAYLAGLILFRASARCPRVLDGQNPGVDCDVRSRSARYRRTRRCSVSPTRIVVGVPSCSQ